MVFTAMPSNYSGLSNNNLLLYFYCEVSTGIFLQLLPALEIVAGSLGEDVRDFEVRRT